MEISLKYIFSVFCHSVLEVQKDIMDPWVNLLALELFF